MTIDPRTARLLHHRLTTLQRELRLPSVSAGITRGGDLVWTGAVGTADGRVDGRPVDADTQYRMGSITKPIVALSVMKLRDAGRLELTDRYEEHVPGTSFGHVSIEQLLTHAAGLQAETNGPWWERTPGDSWAVLVGSEVGQRFRSGRRFHYSNLGFAALGELVARAHGRNWLDVVTQEVLRPLEMTRTTARPTGSAAIGLAVHPFADVLLREPEHDAGAMAPAGQLWSTTRDLSRLAVFVAGDSADVLSGDTLAEMLEPHHVVDDPGQPWQAAHGLGFQVWNVEGCRLAGHGGSMPGFLAGLRVELGSGDGLVSFANSTSAVLGPRISDLLEVFREQEPPPVSPWVADASLDHRSRLELVGTWHWGAGVAVATLQGEHLVLGEPGTARGSRFAPVGPDLWIGLDGYHLGEPLRVIRRPDGQVSHLDLGSFRFTRVPYDPEADLPGGLDPHGWH